VKLLLDTPTSLWFIGGSGRLSAHARQLIEDQGNDRYVCVARLWEMTITVSIGKLSVPLPFTRLVRQHILGNAIDVLPVGPQHLYEQRKLPIYHRHPFDRLTIAQAITEEMTVLRRDCEFEAHPVRLEWRA
jgi:PIN domain nuclease of toxin-antitoxin system